MGCVALIASGETERRALPLLCRDLGASGTTLTEVLVPPRTGQLSPDMALRLARSVHTASNKIVVVVDADGRTQDSILQPFRKKFQNWPSWPRPVFLAHAQWHLEAWFFADQAGLRLFLNDKDLGNLPAIPDDIERPKLRLQHLLQPFLYTAATAREIAAAIHPQVAEKRSPSFAQFRAAMRNGAPRSALP